MSVLMINQAEFRNVIESIRGVSFASIRSVTQLDMRKTGNPFHGKISKVSKVLAIVGNWSYEQSLINQAKRENVETEFEIKPRKWGVRLNDSGIVEHNGRLYLECKIQKCFDSRIVWSDGRYLSHDEIDSVRSFMPIRKESSTQDSIEKKIILRDYAFDSIRKIKLGGITYRIRPNV